MFSSLTEYRRMNIQDLY